MCTLCVPCVYAVCLLCVHCVYTEMNCMNNFYYKTNISYKLCWPGPTVRFEVLILLNQLSYQFLYGETKIWFYGEKKDHTFVLKKDYALVNSRTNFPIRKRSFGFIIQVEIKIWPPLYQVPFFLFYPFHSAQRCVFNCFRPDKHG